MTTDTPKPQQPKPATLETERDPQNPNACVLHPVSGADTKPMSEQSADDAIVEAVAQLPVSLGDDEISLRMLLVYGVAALRDVETTESMTLAYDAIRAAIAAHRKALEDATAPIRHEMRELQYLADIEVVHGDADKLLCEVLRLYGQDELVDAWEQLDKWYA